MARTVKRTNKKSKKKHVQRNKVVNKACRERKRYNQCFAFAPSLNTDRPLHSEGSSADASSEVTIVSAGTNSAVESDTVVADAAAHVHTDTTDAGNIPVMSSASSSTSVTASAGCSVDSASVMTTAASDITMTAAMNTDGSYCVSTDTAAAASETSVVSVGRDSASVVTTAASTGGVTVDESGKLPGNSAEAYASFASLAHVPHRERKSGARKRSAPPSYNLTSTEHLSFVSEKLEQKQKSQKKSVCAQGPTKKKSAKQPQTHRQRRRR